MQQQRMHITALLISLCILSGCACTGRTTGVIVNADPGESIDRQIATVLEADRVSVSAIMGFIHKVRPWPFEIDGDYSEHDWKYLLTLAARLQKVDRSLLSDAIEDYVLHFGTSFDPAVSWLAEWSKVLMLLSAMYEDPGYGAHPSFQLYSGYSYRCKDDVMPPPPFCEIPIRFAHGLVALTAWRSGYNGPEYDAAGHLEYLVEHGKPRDLNPYLKWLRQSGQHNH